jgi:hypothetical protein
MPVEMPVIELSKKKRKLTCYIYDFITFNVFVFITFKHL